MRKMIVSLTSFVIPAKAGISSSLYALVISLLLMSGCSLYDNYDIDLMNDGIASIDSSSDAAVSSSSEEGLPSSSAEEEPSSSSVEKKDTSCEGMERGGVTYATVIIHENCWTAENLHYEPASGNTMCYDDDEANCDAYGLMYDYAAAAAACPTGWRLPTSAEYQDLQVYTGSDVDVAGAHFKTTTGWKGENGDNKLKFSALPGGYCYVGTKGGTKCMSIGSVGYWWTSSEKVMDESHLALHLSGDRQDVAVAVPMDNRDFISVRCIKDK